MLREPATALRERLRLAVDLAYRQSVRNREQVMVDRQEHLAADLKRTFDEIEHRVDDPSVGAVLDRNHAVSRLSPMDLFKNRRNRADWA